LTTLNYGALGHIEKEEESFNYVIERKKNKVPTQDGKSKEATDGESCPQIQTPMILSS
jgi:hypothetical protein